MNNRINKTPIAPNKSGTREIERIVDAAVNEDDFHTFKSSLVADQEVFFACQQIGKLWKNDHGGARAIIQSPIGKESMRVAMRNCVSSGLTLNPVRNFGYLLIRDKKVVFAPSYLGLIEVACREGLVKNASAAVVRKGDKFTWMGVNERPEHHCNPFDPGYDDKPLVGAYCVATYPDGSVQANFITKADIDMAKRLSPGSSSKYSPWQNHPAMMWLKTAVRRGAKYWNFNGIDSKKTAEVIDLIDVSDNGSDPYDRDIKKTSLTAADFDLLNDPINVTDQREVQHG